MTKANLDRLRAFGMSGFQIRDDLTRLEQSSATKVLQRNPEKVSRKIEGFEQFSQSLRSDAIEMAEYYEVFFCLENAIRELVANILKDEFGADWWETDCVKPHIKGEVNQRQQAELDSGFSPRSDNPLDYTTFGELGQLITGNWDQFGTVLNSKLGVNKIMAELNALRSPIAHCCVINELEKDRLELVVKNWLRLVS